MLIAFLVLSAIPCQAAKAKKSKTVKTARIAKAAKVSKAKKSRQARKVHAARTEEIPDFVAFRDDLEKFLGVPYRIGGASAKGMDCSGFAKRFFAEAFGIELPHNSSAISHLSFLDEIPSDPDLYRPSDLLFFGSRKGRINHVGIYLGDGKFVHASRSIGVTVSSLQESYWKRRLLASKRVTILDDSQLTTMAAAGSDFSASGMDVDAVSNALVVGYYQSLIDDRMGIGLDGLYGMQAMSASPASGDWPSADGPTCLAENYNGWRASVDFRPSNWLRITPWMGRLDVHEGLSGASGIVGQYGLRTNISGGLSPWVLSMAAQASHFHDWDAGSSAASIDDWRSLDLGFDFGYRIGSKSSLSVSGWRSGLYDERPKDDLPETLSDVMLRLNIEF